jgi:hypothetical protein
VCVSLSYLLQCRFRHIAGRRRAGSSTGSDGGGQEEAEHSAESICSNGYESDLSLSDFEGEEDTEGSIMSSSPDGHADYGSTATPFGDWLELCMGSHDGDGDWLNDAPAMIPDQRTPLLLVMAKAALLQVRDEPPRMSVGERCLPGGVPLMPRRRAVRRRSRDPHPHNSSRATERLNVSCRGSIATTEDCSFSSPAGAAGLPSLSPVPVRKHRPRKAARHFLLTPEIPQLALQTHSLANRENSISGGTICGSLINQSLSLSMYFARATCCAAQ